MSDRSTSGGSGDGASTTSQSQTTTTTTTTSGDSRHGDDHLSDPIVTTGDSDNLSPVPDGSG